MFSGSIPALVTPFRNGRVDEDAFRAFVDWQIEQGSSALVPCGTTGESATMTIEEHNRVVQICVEQARGRVPVIAGAGSNDTRIALEHMFAAQAAGATAALVVAPYYNKPTQEGLYQHFAAIAAAVDIPQILYNVPGRTGCDISNDTVIRLSAIANIVGIKDATGGIERGTDLLLRVPEDFAIYSGDDATGMALMLLGAQGVISVTANVAPKLMREMCVAAMAGNVAKACEINAKLFGLHQKLFVEANPIPTKWVLQQMGLIQSGIRLPMVNCSAQFHDVLRLAMKSAEISKL